MFTSQYLGWNVKKRVMKPYFSRLINRVNKKLFICWWGYCAFVSVNKLIYTSQISMFKIYFSDSNYSNTVESLIRIPGGSNFVPYVGSPTTWINILDEI